ncbi:MAG: glycosyltransferase family 1 protein [Pedobacter sp.]|nr:MAG: glycosyltransferase family 1 protein [Pedobacter sp.]
MINYKRRILIACDSSHTLLGFRGKLIAELAKTNQVHIFTPKILDADNLQTLKDLKVIVHENELMGSNVSILSDLRYIQNLYRLMRQIKPDIFFPYTFKPVIYGTLIAKICKVKRITPMLTGLGYNFSDQVKGLNIISKITRILLKISLIHDQSLSLIFQNKDDYSKLLAGKIISLKHSTTIVNGSGVDLSHYDFSLPDNKNISFLMIARLINAKGIQEYHEASRLVKLDFPNARFTLIGPYDNNIDSISNALYQKIKSGEVIEYLGQVRDVRPFIKKASIIVLPSYYGEGVPRCLLEGMAIGRPIITCDSVGCRETVVTVPHKQNGFLIPVKNSPALAITMAYYLNNKTEIITQGVNGRAYAQEKFDVNLVNAEMLRVMYA